VHRAPSHAAAMGSFQRTHHGPNPNPPRSPSRGKASIPRLPPEPWIPLECRNLKDRSQLSLSHPTLRVTDDPSSPPPCSLRANLNAPILDSISGSLLWKGTSWRPTVWIVLAGLLLLVSCPSLTRPSAAYSSSAHPSAAYPFPTTEGATAGWPPVHLSGLAQAGDASFKRTSDPDGAIDSGRGAIRDQALQSSVGFGVSQSPAAGSLRDTSLQRRTWLNLRPYPLAIWGPRAGFGGGLGLIVHRVTSRDDELLLSAAPAVHEQVYTVSYTSDADREARSYLMIHGRHAYTDRDWFYGFGPASSPDARTSFSLRTIQGGLRWGHRLWNRALIVQGHGRVEHYRLYGARPPEPTANDPARTAARSYAQAITDGQSARRSTGAALSTTGGVLGVDLAFDRRDRQAFTTRGLLLQATLESWIPVGGDDLSFWRSDVGAYGWIPLGRRHRIALRAHLSQILSPNGDVGELSTGTGAVSYGLPHFLLPVLGGHTVPGLQRRRYAGNDVLMAGLTYEFPIYTDFGFTLEGHVGGHLASVYDDIGSQFELSVDGTRRLGPQRERYPLRPAFSAGVRFGPLFRDQSYVDVAAGRGPDGWTMVRVSFTRSLDRARPPHHESNHWRR